MGGVFVGKLPDLGERLYAVHVDEINGRIQCAGHANSLALVLLHLLLIIQLIRARV